MGVDRIYAIVWLVDRRLEVPLTDIWVDDSTDGGVELPLLRR